MDERKTLDHLLSDLGAYDMTLDSFRDLYLSLSSDLTEMVDGLLDAYLRDETAKLIRAHGDLADAMRLIFPLVQGWGETVPSSIRRLVEYAAALSALGNQGLGPINTAKALLLAE